MGYFSNGTEGLDYQENYCFKCVNFIQRKGEDVPGCRVWDLHLRYNYELCNSKSLAREILDSLIPMSEDGCYNWECSMFLEEKKGK
jgi:hypothetical protein